MPQGTVTFLFTDIEGSTRLLSDLGAGYADALTEHRRVVREALTRYSGVEVDTQGDAFFVAFADADAAVAAAENAQAALELPVRMGVHTGKAQRTEEGYVGLEVHRAARICAVAHGGQVVVSAGTRAALADGAAALTDLGLHRLKDLAEPVRLFQLGEREFPPLRSLNATNLPVQPNSLVGRERELAEITALVRDGARLLTLTGPGGTGKTRLALQAAAELVDDFPDGVYWIPLAAVRDPDLVVPTIEQTLGAKVPLLQHVDERRMLILLDNLEQVVDAAPAITATLARCENLHLLVTSRILLRASGERDYAVLPLADDAALELFRERAVEAEPEGLVREICRRVDHLPLAIELAAARTRVLTARQLLDRLEQRLPVLTGGPRDAPARQRTLRTTIEWSHDLLEEGHKRLFRHLSVFVDGWTLDAAEEVCEADLDTLASLVENSLVRREADRFATLEMIREYALERLLAAGEAETVRRRHAAFYLGLVEERDYGEVPRVDSALRADQANLRAALEWSSERDPELGLRLVAGLESFWPVVNPTEGMRWYETLLERARDAPLDLRARALRAYGGAANPAGRDDLAERAYKESFAAFRELGDKQGEASLLLRLGYAAFYRGDSDEARSLAERGVAALADTGDRRLESQFISLLGEVEYVEGNRSLGLGLMERGVALADEAGFVWWRSGMLGKLADCALERGDLEAAAAYVGEAVLLARDLGDRLRVVRGLARMARIAALSGDPAGAGLLWGAVEAEEARGPVGAWENERARFQEAVRAVAGAPFERSREDGRQLSLDAAVDDALAERP